MPFLSIYRYSLGAENGVPDNVNRGEVELLICWRFNPDVKEPAGNVFSKIGGTISSALGDDDSVVDDDGEVKCFYHTTFSLTCSLGHSFIHYSRKLMSPS